MIEFENYQNNLDVTDKHGLQNIVVNKNVIYSGALSNIVEKTSDVSSRKTPPLAAAVIGLDNTAASISKADKKCSFWTDYDAQEDYLDCKPTCYLILSKPGAGAYSLGEAMAKKLNCIHLCPKNILVDEMDQGSPTGTCISFNLRQQNVMKFDVILSILKKKLESSAVKHRGYVISGFPLISSNRKPHYLTNVLYSEDGLQAIDEVIYEFLVNLKKKKQKKPRPETGSPHSSMSSEADIPNEEEEAEEEHEPQEDGEEEEVIVALPKFILDSCSDIIFTKKPCMLTKKSVFLQQVQELLNFTMKPDIIIYLTCPDKDLVTKKSHKYYNYKSNLNTFDMFHNNSESEIRWPTRYTMSDYISPYDSHIFNPKYSCKQPINFTEQSVEQLCNYKNDVFPFIEDKLNDFDPKNIIKLDARVTTHQMMHHINERLLLLSIKPVLIPEPLYLEEPPEDFEDFWKLVEELNVIRSGVVNFNRSPSLWFNRCPVELKKRRSQRGNPKFAVTLFKHVYLLSTLEGMISFCRNPRPYLQLKYLEPTCRIIVIGTKSSGKTMICNCLSWLFDTPIINYDAFVEEEKEKKYNTYAKTILSEIIATLEDTRFAKWQSLETGRVNKLTEWEKGIISILKKYITVFKEVLKFTKSGVKIKEEGLEEEEIIKPDPKLLTEYEKLKSRLSFLPYLEDLDQCMSSIQERTYIKFAPLELITVTERPAIPVLGDPDVTEAIASYITANDLQKEIEPTIEELMNEMVRILSDIDEESLQKSGAYGKFIIDGFPSDPECWGYLSEAKLLPDNTIALIENREIDPELVQYYAEIAKCRKNYIERFSLANDPLIKTKLHNKTFPNANMIDMENIVNDFISTTLNKMFVENEAVLDVENKETPESDLIGNFTAAIEKFREDWDSVKLKLEEYNKTFIEIELENKTDIEVINGVLLDLRKNYYLSCEVSEDEESEPQEDEDDNPKDVLTYNNPRFLCETGIYCPIAYYDFGVLWEGKSEFSVKHNNKSHYFTKEECSQLFQKDVTKYQKYNKPFKPLPPLRICVIGSIGSGKTTISKLIAKELGLLHIDFSEIVNTLLMPRHFKKVGRQYENSFTDAPIDEEGVMEFQMDEENQNLASDILGNETELRRMVYNYFERGAPLISVLMQKLIKKIWFEEPFVNTGFILDGFPRLPSDVEDMIACYCIPDLIIELEGSSESMLERLSPKMFKTWKTQLNEAKKLAKLKLDRETQEWMNFITKHIVAKVIFEDILDNIFSSIEVPPKSLSAGSVIMDAHPMGSSNVNVHLFNYYNEMIQEYPAPVDQSEWEKPDEARERIDARLESLYEVDDEGIQSLKDILQEQRIRIVSINGTKSLKKVIRTVLFKLTNVRNRNSSFLEQTFKVNNDIAEMLLLEGFFFMSQFYRMCPVYISENPKTITNPYKIMKRRGLVFPVIHRAYIYFIFGEESLKKFRTNPLKYLNFNILSSFIEYPITLSVIGAPKSGKSLLAGKLAKRYGLACISRGMAVRYILETMHWTELASRMKTTLEKGDCINSDHVMKAVQTVAIDHRTLTYGFVFDGFPETASEAMELTNTGLYPTIILDICNDKGPIIKQSQNEIYYDLIKRKPPYSEPFIETRYVNWLKKSYQIRDWVSQDTQNLYEINGKESRWQCLQNAVDYVEGNISKIHYYLNNVLDKIVSPYCMCISNDAFCKRMSSYNDMCPLCLQFNVLRHSGYPVDKKGVVQFKDKFYWICPDHMTSVLKYPEYYLYNKKVEIPEIPAVVKTVNVAFVYENGVCIVTYAQNLPCQKIVRGSHKYAASFQGKTYLFCSPKCLEMFLAKPHMYHDIEVFKGARIFPQLSLKQLPNIGYLEQTIGKIITEACCSVNVVRPKYPGLSIKASAALYIALYLKSHNPISQGSVIPLYTKALKIYDARCRLMIDLGLRLRSMDNPFAKYPKCCSKIKYLDSGTVRKPSSISDGSESIHTIMSDFHH